MKILLTGFEPFGGETVNPAWEAVCRVHAPDGVTLSTLQIPTVFGLAGERVLDAVRRERPDAVLCLGQAAGRAALTPERVAINLRDASLPDNAGNQPEDEPIVSGGPAAYFSTLPVKAMVRAIREAGLPAVVSCSAGTFVCNDLLYMLLSALAETERPIPAGFLHLPCLPEQAASRGDGTPSLPLGDLVRGVEAALGAIAVWLPEREDTK